MCFTVVPFGQGFKDMSPPTKELMKLTLEQKLAHGGHPVLLSTMIEAFPSYKMQKLSNFNSFCISVHKLVFSVSLCYTSFLQGGILNDRYSTNSKRDLYLNKIIAFQDTEPVKVVTGIRRCGKSSLLKLMTLHLKETGITDNQILEMNFESHKFKNMTSDSLYEYVKQHIQPDKRMYLFFDEVQRVPNWEDAINSFRIDFN